MKLKLNWILPLVLILVASSSFAQYPVTKKIGKDTVILMTVKQGEQINKMFDDFEAQVTTLKDSISMLRSRVTVTHLNLDSSKVKFDTLTYRYNILNQSYTDSATVLNDYRTRYYKNLDVYKKYELETNRELWLHRLNTSLMAILVFFLYSQVR
jgi:hypothetical protein